MKKLSVGDIFLIGSFLIVVAVLSTVVGKLALVGCGLLLLLAAVLEYKAYLVIYFLISTALATWYAFHSNWKSATICLPLTLICVIAMIVEKRRNKNEVKQ